MKAESEEASFVEFQSSHSSSVLDNELLTGVKVQTKVNLKVQFQEYLKILKKEVLQPNEETVNTLLQNYQIKQSTINQQTALANRLEELNKKYEGQEIKPKFRRKRVKKTNMT